MFFTLSFSFYKEEKDNQNQREVYILYHYLYHSFIRDFRKN